MYIFEIIPFTLCFQKHVIENSFCRYLMGRFCCAWHDVIEGVRGMIAVVARMRDIVNCCLSSAGVK